MIHSSSNITWLLEREKRADFEEAVKALFGSMSLDKVGNGGDNGTG